VGGYEQMKKYFGLINTYIKAENLLINNNSMLMGELEESTENRYDIKEENKTMN